MKTSPTVREYMASIGRKGGRTVTPAKLAHLKKARKAKAAKRKESK